MQHPSLAHPPSNLIASKWMPLAGSTLQSFNPAKPGEVVWSGSPNVSHVNAAISAAKAAQPAWHALGMEGRIAVLRTFQKLATQRMDALTQLLVAETGKVTWDAKAEAGLLASKVDITLDASAEGALKRVTPYTVDLTKMSPQRTGSCEFRPHGVMAVLGPFNFPAHLPNGHIVPALALGNTIVFKPSDKTPAVGQFLAELFDEALQAHNAPAGVLNLVQGAADVASAISTHDDIDGILFTGSWPVGKRIMQANLDRPGRILALEMGGNNPAIIMPDADLRQAVIECIRCAFITSGQRCTCTRRVIVHEAVASKVISAVCKGASSVMIGDPQANHPVFMGPVISQAARDHMLSTIAALAKAGGEVLVPARSLDDAEAPTRGIVGSGWYITPSVMRVEKFIKSKPDASIATAGDDVEVFGPFLRIAIVKNLDDAIEQANATGFGLAASIFTKDQSSITRFLQQAKAGCLNVNAGTAGASSKLPFGGLGYSGNHRPAGSFSVDYCAYPVGCMVENGPAAAIASGMKFDDAWLA